MRPEIEQTDFTPPQVGKMLGINPSRVINFIRTGELEAYNVSTKNQPRYRVSSEAIERFRKTRAVNPKSKRKTKKRTSNSPKKKHV